MSPNKLPADDVLIVGGGISGLAASIALGKRGVHTTVVERGDGALGAAIGISYRAVYALEDLGILQQVIEGAAIVPAGRQDELRGTYRPDGEQLPLEIPELGADWTLPQAVRTYRPFLSQVMRSAAEEHGAKLLFGCSYRSVQPLGDKIEAELTTGERHTFDLMIAADGVHSELRTRFFPESAQPTYTGSMSFRMMFKDVPPDWRSGLHTVNGTTIATTMLPGGVCYMAAPSHMEHRYIEQDEAREIVRGVLEEYRPSKMFDDIYDRLGSNVPVIIAPHEWIFVEPPWHRGRLVLIGDAIHATAPTLGMAGGMAFEDAVVLAQELDGARDIDTALTKYAERRCERAKIVVETSAALMRQLQQHRPIEENAAMRKVALQKLVEPY